MFLLYKVARESPVDEPETDSEPESDEQPQLTPMDPYVDKNEYLIPSAKKTDQVVADSVTPEMVEEAIRQQEEQQQVIAALLQRVDTPMEIPLWTSVSLVPNPTSPINDVVESDEPRPSSPCPKSPGEWTGRRGSGTKSALSWPSSTTRT
eukprot:jgi/Mesvir1/25838/Mv18194-RA.1